MTTTFPFKINGVLTDMDSVQLGDQSGSFGIKRADTNAIVLGATYQNLDHPSVGTYAITFTEPTPGLNYTYALKVVYQGITQFITSTSSISSLTNLSLSSIPEADNYFATKLYSDIWNNATTNQKQAALNDATQIIDRFAYIGSKSNSIQEHEWPRKGIYIHESLIDSSLIPSQILKAQYEIAIALLKGFDPEREIRSSRVQNRGYSSVRTAYDTSHIPEYLQFGIPSAVAWQYLSPFLDRSYSTSVILRKVD